MKPLLTVELRRHTPSKLWTRRKCWQELNERLLKPVGVPSNQITDHKHFSSEDPYRGTSAHVACHNKPSVPSRVQEHCELHIPVTTTFVMYGGSAKVNKVVMSFELYVRTDCPLTSRGLPSGFIVIKPKTKSCMISQAKFSLGSRSLYSTDELSCGRASHP